MSASPTTALTLFRETLDQALADPAPGRPAHTLVGYADRISVAPGDTVSFKVSCFEGGFYDADLVRIVCGDQVPGGAGFEVAGLAADFAGRYPARRQETNIGSCILVPLPDGFAAAQASFSYEAVVFATAARQRPQCIMGTWDEETRTGVSLVIAADGCLALRFATTDGRDHTCSTGTAIPLRRWIRVVAACDQATGTLSLGHAALDQPSAWTAREWRLDHAFRLGNPASFAIAAWQERSAGRRPWMAAHFNGKLDRVAWHASAIPFRARPSAEPSAVPPGRDLLASWDFSRCISSDRIVDVGPHGLDGATVNLPSRAVLGCSAAGSGRSWQEAPADFSAIHFHDDDLLDAGWDTDFRFVVPATCRSGIYAARVTSESDRYYIVFFVRPGAGQATAPIAFLASTATYMAYGNEKIMSVANGVITGDPAWTGHRVFQTLKRHPEFGASHYDWHSDGDGVRFSSRLRPLLNLQPGTDLVWAFSQDTLLTAWLERNGYAFDVITDEDLDRDGIDLLKRYRVLVTGSHPEYFSTPMLDAIEGFADAGGRLMYLGGNGFFWNVSFNADRTATELRRMNDQIAGDSWLEEKGQTHHAFDGVAGGLWHWLGRHAARLVGVEYVGLNLTATETRYRRATSLGPAEFVFAGVEGDVVNAHGLVYPPFADEIDQMLEPAATGQELTLLASSDLPEVESIHEAGKRGRADMVLLRRPGGGAVFSASAISWGRGLAARGGDNDVARVTANVLNRFLDPAGL